MTHKPREHSRLQPILISLKLREAIEETEKFKTDSNGLLNLLVPHSQRLKAFESLLGQAVKFWSLSSVLQEMRNYPDIMDKFRPVNSHPKDSEDDKVFSRLLQTEAFTSASIVFRTWISLIYLRSDELLKVLREIGKETRNKHLISFLKLLSCDDTRHIRNALSHGTFSAFAMELEYRDENHSDRISYDQLDRLNFGIYSFLLSVWAATMAPESN